MAPRPAVPVACPLLIALVCLAVPAQTPLFGAEKPRYPEGAATPRSLTAAERAWWAAHRPAPPLVVTSPPTGPVHCVAEYEPMEGLLIAWEGTSSWLSILSQIAFRATTTGDADVYVMVDTASEQASASGTLSGAGVDMARVHFSIVTTDTIWIRDYGPRYIYEGDCRAIVDHTYNRPRPNDDVLPAFFATVKHHAFYEHQLVHGGGNFHLDALRRSYVTRLINNENPSLTEQQIHGIWLAYQNVDTTFFDPFPTSVDATQHIDMWMQVVADDKVVISDWPNNAGSVQDVICDNAAAFMSGRGYSVYRVPARSVGGVHYTYTNVVLCNNLVLIPYYTNATVSPHNAQALAAWQSAMPGHSVVQINSDAIVSAAGVLHCVVMHLPAHRGGTSPTVYLKTQRGGETLVPGSAVEIRWISDDDLGTTTADILLSTNGGVTYTTTLAAATPDDGSFFWTVPDICCDGARIRVVVRDAVGNTGSDSSVTDMRLTGAAPGSTGDCNCDCQRNTADVEAFALALTDPAVYAASYPGCPPALADIDGNGRLDGRDIRPFVESLLY